MSDHPEASGSGSGEAGQVHKVLLTFGCLLPLLAVPLGAGSLAAHFVIKSPTSPYHVAFSTSGRACVPKDPEDTPLRLDQDTGEVLHCGLLMDANAWGPFSADEVSRVTGLSKACAADGHLSHADRDAVERLVAEIGREHGYDKTSPTLLERLTLRLGLCALICGLVGPACLGLWEMHKESLG
ncbi:hypothetical protein [Actinomadura litoris]|uniref:hypothetical protein n=1 Tax=Actinomadura litoris TaxID=2678616 RepID=UPI001FA713F4|nr:hypothetical protein [Actinomadura litoris]